MELAEQVNLSCLPKKISEAERIENNGRTSIVLGCIIITVAMALSVFAITPAWTIYALTVGSVFMMITGLYRTYLGSTQHATLLKQMKAIGACSSMKETVSTPNSTISRS